MNPTPREPRAWMLDASKFGIEGYSDDEYWRGATTPAEQVLRGAAQRQHDRCVDLRGLISGAQHRTVLHEVPTPELTRFATYLAVMSYDTLWAVLHGRVKLTLVHEEDIKQARVQAERAVAAQRMAAAPPAPPQPPTR